MSAHESDGLPSRLSRRAALQVIAGSAGALSFPILNNAQHPSGQVAGLSHQLPVAQGAARAYSPKFFDAQQIRTIEAICETIIPADNHSPGAKAARVYAYIDTIVADSDEERKNFWRKGLAAIDKMAAAEYGEPYTACTPEQQIALLEKLSANEEHPHTLDERFFVAVKRATIEGYYTSEVGIHKELEYQGNTALEDFEGCEHKEHGA